VVRSNAAEPGQLERRGNAATQPAHPAFARLVSGAAWQGPAHVLRTPPRRKACIRHSERLTCLTAPGLPVSCAKHRTHSCLAHETPAPRQLRSAAVGCGTHKHCVGAAAHPPLQPALRAAQLDRRRSGHARQP